MGVERRSEYYDDIFNNEKNFNVHYKESPYWVHWTQAIKYLGNNKNIKILEIGCGTGQLAEYLRDQGFNNYSGFDFSHVAITKAKKRIPEFNFYIGDALEKIKLKGDYDIAICLEVLEHVENDKAILRNIEEGKTLIFSVPNFIADSHVRWFVKERQIKSRYYRLLNIKNIVRVGNIYICIGIRSNYKPRIFNRITKTREKFDSKSILKRAKHYLNNLSTYFQK